MGSTLEIMEKANGKEKKISLMIPQQSSVHTL